MMPMLLTRTGMPTTTTIIETITELKKGRKLFTHPVRHVAKQTIPQSDAIMEPMQPIDRLSGRGDRKDQIRSTKEPFKMTQMKIARL